MKMNKRAKRVLAFGVASIMAAAAIPSCLSASAIPTTNQMTNGGTDYNFILNQYDASNPAASGVSEIHISSEEIAAGDVVETMGAYIDTTEWASDNYIDNVVLNWCVTKDKPLTEGAEVNYDLFLGNILDPSQQLSTPSDGNGLLSEASNYPIYSLANLTTARGKTTYTTTNCTTQIVMIACDNIYGGDMYYNGDGTISFEVDYLENYAAYQSGTKTHRVYTLPVQTGDDGIPYVTYDYIVQGGTVDANYVQKTTTVKLPYYDENYATNGHYVTKDGDDKKYVMGNGCFFGWCWTGSSATKFVGDSSTSYPMTTFDVTVPQGTADGTYYVQLCTRDIDCNVVPLYTAEDFTMAKDAIHSVTDTGTILLDMSTMVGSTTKDDSYHLPQNADNVTVKIVIGDGSSDSGETEEIAYGDVNGDGKIDITDAFLNLQETTNISAGKAASFDADTLKRADVDGDGKITISDAFAILNYATNVSAGLTVDKADYFSVLKK